MAAPTSIAARSSTALLLLRQARRLSPLGVAELTRTLNDLAGSAEFPAIGPDWWSGFDEHARHVDQSLLSAAAPAPRWYARRLTGSQAPPSQKLPPGWEWALAVCAADGRTRQRALDAEALPLGEDPLIPLLVVRCSDWAQPVRAAARAALADVLASSGPAELARAAVMAWSCERRRRGGDAVRIVTARLAGAVPETWQELFADPDRRVRRRALSAAVDLDRCEVPELLRLATSDHDAVVARSAAEQLLRSLVPPGDASPATPQAEAVLGRLLASRMVAVRAVTVTVLRRAQRPDLAAPFTVDRSRQVREIARWVLRSHGQDSAPFCRARLARPAVEITPGVIAGVAESGDASAPPAGDLLRPYLTHQSPGVRAAALLALGTMRPAAVTTTELLTAMANDPAPRVRRTAATLLEAEAGAVPRRCLDDLLASGRPTPLRMQAARIIRAISTWERLEIGLRLMHDADPDMAAPARRDVHAWSVSAAAGHAQPTDEQRQTLLALLHAAAPAIDDRDLRSIRFALRRTGRP